LSRIVTLQNLRTIEQIVAERVRQRRMLLRVSMEDLGRAIGAAYQTISKYEHGETRIPSGRLYGIARTLDMPVAWFFGEGEAAPHDLDAIRLAARIARLAPPERKATERLIDTFERAAELPLSRARAAAR
jgi:transcriptional regulator with XRE-family HTH domain